MDIGLFCTDCKDNQVKPDVSWYALSRDFPRLETAIESNLDLRDVVTKVAVKLKAQREYNESPIGQGLACKDCKREFNRTEDRWQPRDGEDCYRVMSLDEADANRERVRAENAKVKFYGKTYFESQ